MTFTKFNEFSYATTGALYMLSFSCSASSVFVSAISAIFSTWYAVHLVEKKKIVVHVKFLMLS